MIPSRILIAGVALPTLLSVVTIWRPELLRAVLLADAVIILLALLDRFISKAPQLELRIEARDVFSIGQNNPISVFLSQGARGRVRVRLRPNLPPELHCQELSSLEDSFSLLVQRERESLLKCHIVPEKRGEFYLEAWTVRSTSRLGFWTLQSEIGERRAIRVYPDLAMIRTYELLARQQRQNALVRATRLKGGESEFARLRDYTPDDDPRLIDWRATARRDCLTTREYQLESDQNIFFILDAGRLMSAFVGGMSQFDHALNSSLLMAHVAGRGGDRVGMMCFDDDVRVFHLPKAGPKTVARLVRETYSLHPQLKESAYQRALQAVNLRMKQRSLIVLFTQLIDDTSVDELSRQLRVLARRHLPLVVILEDTDLVNLAAEQDDSLPLETELFRRGAAAELLLWKQRSLKRLQEAGAHVLETPAHALSEKVVNRYLEIKMQGAL